jgi:glucose 1-dehydrogenase
MLQGKRALVTGSSAGIGLAVAKSLYRHGAMVIATSERDRKEMPEVESDENRDCEFMYYKADLTNPEELEELADVAWNTFRGIDILVNNVGMFREPDFFSLTKADFDCTFGLNVWTAIELTRSIVGKAKAVGRGGRILFSSSLNGSRSEPGHTLYDSSKGAVNALTRQLAVELASLGWTTAAVAPGLVETPLTDFGLRSDLVARQQVIDQIPLRRIATVEDVAEWYSFLASDAACYATGIVIPVCGGLDAQQMSMRPMTKGERYS